MNTTMQRGWEMREVKVKRHDLLVKIKANREKHVADYKEACNGFIDAATDEIDKIQKDLKSQSGRLFAGKIFNPVALEVSTEMPVSHQGDYDQVIAMIEMSVDDEIMIRSDEFACYVLDKWAWKQSFGESVLRYKGVKGMK